jgi:hypothetical protein
MKPFFRIELLPAKQGDAIWVEYGNSERTRRIMIDAGPIDAYPEVEAKLKTLPAGDKRVEAVIITHVDTDHIEGIIRMLAEKRNKWLIAPEDIWFNGFRHMKETGLLGGMEGDYLSALLHHRAFENWNKKFGQKPVVILPNSELPSIHLADGMKITLLSPDKDKLKKMAGKWEDDVTGKNLRPGDLDAAWERLVKETEYHLAEGILGGPGDIDEAIRKQLKADQSKANGSSIAFLAEFEGKHCLFLADAHHSVITSSIKKLIPPGENRLKVDAVKVSHHGSRNNISKALMEVIDAKHFLISTNGAQHNHPDKSAITAIIQGSLQDPVLWFNYTSNDNKIWKPNLNPSLRPYTANYPKDGEEGIVVEL